MYLSMVVYLGLQLTVVVWFVADSEAIPYQATPNFNKSENLEISTATAINYTTCCQQFLFFFNF
jgi:hypothetical protein